MNHSQPENPVTGIIAEIAGLLHFSKEAMATTFDIFIQSDNDTYAGQACAAAFNILDNLESKLSRFIENGDIARINNLAVNTPLILSLEAFESLEMCVKLYRQTLGAFDVTAGLLVSTVLDKLQNPKSPVQTSTLPIKLDKNTHTIQVLEDSIKIDLGGFGKGYAIDEMAELLLDWDVKTSLVSCRSTVLAVGLPPDNKGWPLTMTNPKTSQLLTSFRLKSGSVSGSGLQKGCHIMDPRKALPATGKIAAWAAASDAATADALSTAFMVMSPEEIKKYCLKHKDTSGLIITEKNNVLSFGKWKEELVL